MAAFLNHLKRPRIAVHEVLDRAAVPDVDNDLLLSVALLWVFSDRTRTKLANNGQIVVRYQLLLCDFALFCR